MVVKANGAYADDNPCCSLGIQVGKSNLNCK
jgi:hypothetical protein